jgi:molecular chaperone GrpE
MTADRSKPVRPPAPPEIEDVHADIPSAAVADALRSVERAAESARTPKGRGKPVVYDLDEIGADADLEALLRVLDESDGAPTAATTGDGGGVAGSDEGIGALLDLLNAAVDETEKAVPARKPQPKAAASSRETADVAGGDEIIARLLAGDHAARRDADPTPPADAALNGTEDRPADRPAERPAERPAPSAAAIESELLAIKEKQLQDVMERFARLQSDFESYKKRMDREREETRKFAGEQVLLTILPIVDSFERALNHARQQRDLKAFEDGILLIYKQFRDVLLNAGLRPVESVGRKFDPRFHEAVVHIEDPTAEANTVTSEYQKGYTLHDRLLRPARVIVAKGRTPAGRKEE